MSLKLALRGYRLTEDLSLAELLSQQHQSPWLVKNLWEPLCLATLNTPLHKASAQLFLRVLRDSFSQRRSDSDLLLSKVPLGELLCENVARFLPSTGDTRLHLGEKVSGLGVTDGKISGVIVNDETLPCAEVVLATSATAATRLLQPIAQTSALSEQIAAFHYQPITTVYLHYPDRTLPFPMLGMTGTLSQWVFDRAHCDQPGWFAVVISAEGKHDEWDKEQIATQVQQELAQQLPDWPQQAEQWHLIREKRATFECRVGIEAQRPGNTTPLEGLWLAGDYTNTGYPATLEGAVRSGVQCARRIIARRKQPD
jgi:hydroxysqualene dehydroxylase